MPKGNSRLGAGRGADSLTLTGRGRILEEDVTALRERVDLVQIVQEYLALRKRGRLFWGLCPFHQEKTPSFKVDAETQLYHCFGCGQGGNVFTFVMQMEKVDFPDAAEHLADKVGLELRREGGGQRTPGPSDRILRINQLTLEYYHYLLMKSQAAGGARTYLAQRKFGSQVAADYKLGYAPDSGQALLRFLQKKGFSPEDQVKAGVIGNRSGRHRDLFRQRIIFPIHDLRGRPVAFGGRLLGDGQPKYLNSPETPVYHKGSMLYGLYQAKGEISRSATALVVEGYTDVIALRVAGIPGVVATLGTALTEEQVRLLNRFAKRIVLFFDSDKAGQSAAERTFGLRSALALRDRSRDILVISLPEGKDPADWIAVHEAGELEDMIEGATPLVEFCIRQVLRRHPVRTGQDRVKAVQAALRLCLEMDWIVPLPDSPAPSPEDEDAVRIIADAAGFDPQGVFATLRQLKSSRRRDGGATGREGAAGGSSPPVPLSQPEELAEREMLKLLLQREEARELAPFLEEAHFRGEHLGRLLAVLKENPEGINTLPSRLHLLPDEIRVLASELLLEPINADDILDYSTELYQKLKEFQLARQIGVLKSRLERMNPLKVGDEYDELFRELVELEAARRDLRTILAGGGN